MRLSFAVLFVICLHSGFSQQADSLLLPGSFSQYSVDHLGNIYTVTKQDTLIKHVFDKTRQTYLYSNGSLGDISAIDVTNPMQIIVSHNELSTLVLLDVTLRETSRIYLPDLEIYSNPIAFAQLNDGTMWVYDDLKVELIRINATGELVGKTQSIIQQVDFVPIVQSMQANEEYLLLHDKERGFLVFDQFGEFIKFLPLKDVHHFQLFQDQIIYKKNNQLQTYPISSVGVSTLATLPEVVTQCWLVNNTIYFLTAEGVQWYPLKQSK